MTEPPHAETEARAVDAALAELRRLRRAPRVEWDTLHGDAITKALSEGATYQQVNEACGEPGD